MRVDRWFVSLAVLGLLSVATPAPAEDDKGEEKAKVKLPKAVAKVVKAKYPKATIRGTAKEKDEEGETVYEVELLVKGKTVDLLIDEEGEIEEIEKEIPASALPKAVTKALLKAYPKAKIEKAEEVTLEDDKVLYEIALASKGKKVIEVVVVPNGKIVKSAEIGEDEDDKAKKEMDDEDEDDKPKAKKKEMDEDEDEDDDKPKAKKKEKGEDDEDEDDKPKAKKKEKGEDDEDDKPKAKKKEKGEDDED